MILLSSLLYVDVQVVRGMRCAMFLAPCFVLARTHSNIKTNIFAMGSNTVELLQTFVGVKSIILRCHAGSNEVITTGLLVERP